jgi:hypothetical protein
MAHCFIFLSYEAGTWHGPWSVLHAPGVTAVLRGVMASMLTPNVLGFKPCRGDEFVKGNKNQQHAFLRRGSQAVGPISNVVAEWLTLLFRIREVPG